MPQLIPVAFAYGAAAVGTATALATATTVVLTVAAAVSSMLVSEYQQGKAAKKARDAFNASLEDRLAMTATVSGPRTRDYGRVRKSGAVVFKGTHGDVNKYYTLMLAISGHEIDGFETIFLNDVPVELDADGYVWTEPFLRRNLKTVQQAFDVAGGAGSVTLTGTPLPGSLSVVVSDGADSTTEWPYTLDGGVLSISGAPSDAPASAYFQYVEELPKARIWKFVGAPGQDLSTLLAPKFPSLITSADKFQGIAALVIELEFDQDAYPSGVPNVSAIIRGAKVFDPRTGATSWTENPALIARDWALYEFGGNCLASDLNEARFTAAANACDVVTDFETVDGIETRPLYQCGLSCVLDARPDQWMNEVVEAMAGRWGWAGGRLSIVAGAYRAPVAEITEDWLTDAEDIQIVPQPSRGDVVNVYRPSISDARGYEMGDAPEDVDSTAYVVAPAPEVRSEVFVAADGQELARAIPLSAVTRNVHAQHICGVLMRDSRDGLTTTLSCNLRAFKLELFDVVTVTLPFFGYVAKEFEVLDWKFNIAGGVTLMLKETSASIYDPASGLGVLDAAANTSLPVPWDVPQVTGVTVTSGTTALLDGTLQTRALVTWDAVPSEAVRQSGKVEVQYLQLTNDPLPTGDWPSWVEEGSATNATVTGLLAGKVYLFRVRAINTLPVRGSWSVQVAHVLAPQVPVPKFWRQASAPGTGAHDGDVWYDTDDGNKQYLRVAGAWVTVQDAGIAAAAAAAAAAQASATAAAADASTAIGALADISNDNVLAPGEKPQIMLDVSVILAEQGGIDAQATSLAITTEKADYDTAVSTLTAYLTTLTSPVAWNNLTGKTTISGTAFRARFSDVYAARQTLLNKIAVTLGVGAVDTINIAPGAATEIIVGSLDPGPYVQAYSVTLPGNVSVTPSVNCRMTVTTTATIGASNATGSTKKIWADVNVLIGGPVYDQKKFIRNIASGEEWSTAIVCSYTVDASAGTTYLCGMDYSDWTGATQQTTLTNIQTRVELIKR